MPDSGSNPERNAGVLPPPPATRDDAPEQVTVPPLEPPPASLEAMVHRRQGAQRPAEKSPWLLLVALFLLGMLLTMYFHR